MKNLPYPYYAFEPIISEEAMIEHHLKHHKGYVEKLTETLKDYPDLVFNLGGVEGLISQPKLIPSEIKEKVIDFGGGVFTHDFFWDSITPNGSLPSSRHLFMLELRKYFGSIEGVNQELLKVGKSHFGSGWVWLSKTKRNELRVESLDNQQTPLMRGHTPLLCIDLWEHAYYLDHKSDRGSFLEGIIPQINWALVAERWENSF